MKIKGKNIGIKELSAIVSERLSEAGIDAILVGGACVSLYTKNKYLSSDLDFYVVNLYKADFPCAIGTWF